MAIGEEARLYVFNHRAKGVTMSSLDEKSPNQFKRNLISHLCNDYNIPLDYQNKLSLDFLRLCIFDLNFLRDEK
ncbi:unnamed protein product [Brassica rapa]|uniref:Uncharacterized protein n=2 Tax=Brassica TaxID=3705 RepID=A0A8D9I726_BRACM|nr:unnamed protein product [Brassica napus]CAG7911447.1 unnamed protein product [Brassica rapa]